MHDNMHTNMHTNMHSNIHSNAKKVTLISCDLNKFVIEYDLAVVSKTLRMFLDSTMPFKEAKSRIVTLPIKSQYLRRIIEFMKYKYKNSECLLVSEFKITESESLELLNVAAYMDV